MAPFRSAEAAYSTRKEEKKQGGLGLDFHFPPLGISVCQAQCFELLCRTKARVPDPASGTNTVPQRLTAKAFATVTVDSEAAAQLPNLKVGSGPDSLAVSAGHEIRASGASHGPVTGKGDQLEVPV
eukprot:3055345-Rhodomonas_salina.1